MSSNSKIEPEKVRTSLNLSLADGFLYSLMVGLGETYLPAYVLSIGLGEIYAGLLASLPLLGGAVIQLFVPKFLKITGSTKRWIVLSTVVQAGAFLPLVYFTLTHAPDFWTMLLILTLYWGAGFSAGPAWNYWMGHLVPRPSSAKYFSRRTRIQQWGLLIGLVLGGVALHNKVVLGAMTSVFTGLFALAFSFRLASGLLLSRQSFSSSWELENSWSLKESWSFFIKRSPQNKFFLFLFVYQIMIFISSPFVTPYMLAQAKMDYGAYMIAIASLMIGKIFSLWIIEKWNSQKQGVELLKIGLLAVSPMPILWAFSSNYIYIVILQLISGLAWAFLEVGLILVFFKGLQGEEKIPFLTFYNFLNSLAILIGTGIGALVLKFGGAVMGTYFVMFALGGGLRILASWPLLKQLNAWQKT